MCEPKLISEYRACRLRDCPAMLSAMSRCISDPSAVRAPDRTGSGGSSFRLSVPARFAETGVSCCEPQEGVLLVSRGTNCPCIAAVKLSVRSASARAPGVVPAERHLEHGFVFDALANGRRIKRLTIVDDFARENVDIALDHGISGQYVKDFSQAVCFHGYPRAVRADNRRPSSPVATSWPGRSNMVRAQPDRA